MKFGLFDSSLEKFALYLCAHYMENHSHITNNISNCSTPGYKGVQMPEHINYTTFGELIKENQSIKYPTSLEYIGGDVKPNGNDIDENQQHKLMVSNESKVRLMQSTMEKILEIKEIAAGIKHY